MNSRAAVLAVLLTAVIVWQVPHTIVLRYGLLIILGALAWPVAFRRLAHPATPIERSARTPFIWLAAFVLWALCVALFVSPTPWNSVTDLRAEWLAPVLILLLGYGLAIRYGEADVALRVVFLALVLHAFMQMVAYPVLVTRGDAVNVLNFGGIGNHKANVTYTNALALAMLIAHTAARAEGGAGFLGIDARWGLGAFALLLASSVLATTRNGLMVFALLTLAGIAIVGWRLRARASRTAWATLIGCLVLTAAGAIAGMKADPRWSSFTATAPIAWDTERNRQWLQGEGDERNLPMTPAGKRVDASAYFRIAYVHEALKLMVERPWGTRVGRDSFRLAIQDKYGVGRMSHAHSGFLDLGVGVGWPGVALWSAFLASLVVYAARAKVASGSGLRLALVLVVAAFTARSLIDATVRDHILQEFMLVAGMLCGAIGLRDRG